jgi:hypothetical protein
VHDDSSTPLTQPCIWPSEPRRQPRHLTAARRSVPMTRGTFGPVFSGSRPLRARIADLKAVVAIQDARIARLQAQIVAQDAELSVLRSRSVRNSCNSSILPSQSVPEIRNPSLTLPRQRGPSCGRNRNRPSHPRPVFRQEERAVRRTMLGSAGPRRRKGGRTAGLELRVNDVPPGRSRRDTRRG